MYVVKSLNTKQTIVSLFYYNFIFKLRIALIDNLLLGTHSYYKEKQEIDKL